MNIRNQLEAIYIEAFGSDEEEFRNFLFNNCLSSLRYSVENEKVVSNLFAFECNLILDKKIIPSIYIYAAATKKESQGKGYMSALIEKTIKEFPNHFIFLRPANESLIKFYSRLGFKSIKAKSKISNDNYISPIGDFKTLTQNIKPNGDDFTLMYFHDKYINETINFIYSME